jgi:hypothetical protein
MERGLWAWRAFGVASQALWLVTSVNRCRRCAQAKESPRFCRSLCCALEGWSWQTGTLPARGNCPQFDLVVSQPRLPSVRAYLRRTVTLVPGITFCPSH